MPAMAVSLFQDYLQRDNSKENLKISADKTNEAKNQNPFFKKEGLFLA
jgi:hypothetical protein